MKEFAVSPTRGLRGRGHHFDDDLFQPRGRELRGREPRGRHGSRDRDNPRHPRSSELSFSDLSIGSAPPKLPP